jgi:hypothetical protein
MDLSQGRPMLMKIDSLEPMTILISFSIAPAKAPGRVVQGKQAECVAARFIFNR